jgi:hypothetical protein
MGKKKRNFASNDTHIYIDCLLNADSCDWCGDILLGVKQSLAREDDR